MTDQAVVQCSRNDCPNAKLDPGRLRVVPVEQLAEAELVWKRRLETRQRLEDIVKAWDHGATRKLEMAIEDARNLLVHLRRQ